jgi:UDP-glucose:glycoprotein glucosyltransferase
VILYASLSSPNFRKLHSHLLSLTSKPTPQVEYVVWYIPPATRADALNRSDYLSGYGVALDLKKMDYLTVDDRHGASGGLCWCTLILLDLYSLYFDRSKARCRHKRQR